MQESIAPVDCTRAAVAVEEFVYPFSLVLILQLNDLQTILLHHSYVYIANCWYLE